MYRVYTYYTSFLFGLVALFAQTTPHVHIQLLYWGLYGTSILNHAKYYEPFPGKHLVKLVDKVIAHTITIASMYLALTHPHPQPLPMMIFWGCLTWIVLIYYVYEKSHLPGVEWEPWHATVHIACVVGQVALLYQTSTLTTTPCA